MGHLSLRIDELRRTRESTKAVEEGFRTFVLPHYWYETCLRPLAILSHYEMDVGEKIRW